MGKDKLFSHPRWSEPIKGETIGKVEFTEEEKKENKKKLRDHLKKIGVIKED
ncbi:hypothetical protein [Bacillus norwichensis]|uniref:Uncharacterized protein n=1 Tax=Bacillus norwichensis TaxID=2762217 RepID=A0ABR8VRS5_9BACI|nr:hypothetical protein [Bacillus norwichensis]MBD8007455.1 hypothetical protein [Bacillus norwichensis]